MSKRAKEKTMDAWAIYEYREHPKGLYHTCFVDGYKEGYEQAEKDLALTWEDVKLIVECYNKAADSPSTIQWGLGSDIHCEDALYLYNKKKQAKEINESKTSMSKIGKD